MVVHAQDLGAGPLNLLIDWPNSMLFLIRSCVVCLRRDDNVIRSELGYGAHAGQHLKRAKQTEGRSGVGFQV